MHVCHLGCISPRFIVDEAKRYERERIANKSTYWILFELTWRDFFFYQVTKYGNEIFKAGGARKVHKFWNTNPDLIAR